MAFRENKIGTKLSNRFVLKGWSSANPAIGTVRRDSIAEIRASINRQAKTNTEIAEFAKEIDKMNPRHLCLAHDIIDLAESSAQPFVSEELDIRFSKKTKSGKTIMGELLSRLPKVSRECPEILDLAQTILDCTGQTNGKFFIFNLFNSLKPETLKIFSKQIEALNEVFPTLIKDEPIISPVTDPFFQKRNSFFNFITNTASGRTIPDSLRMIPKILSMADEICIKSEPEFDMRLASVDTDKLKDNMRTLPFWLENLEQGRMKHRNITDILINNVNLD